MTGNVINGLWKAPRKCSSPASPVVPSSPALITAAIVRPAGRLNIVGMFQRDVSRTRSEQKPMRPESKIANGAPSGAP